MNTVNLKLIGGAEANSCHVPQRIVENNIQSSHRDFLMAEELQALAQWVSCETTFGCRKTAASHVSGFLDVLRKEAARQEAARQEAEAAAREAARQPVGVLSVAVKEKIVNEITKGC
jgi:hypothetical protein